MFGKLFRMVDSRLWLRVLFPLSIIIMAVVAVSTWYNVFSQMKSGEMLLKNQNRILSQVVEGSMFDALSVGDNDIVRAQFKRLNESIKDLKVFVYDFNGQISFSTQLDSVGKDVGTFMDEKSASDIKTMLDTGQSTDKAFTVHNEENMFLVKNDPILNDSRCFHCHGEKRKTLGGISVFSSEKAVKTAILEGRTTSILIGIAGLSVIVLFIWFFFHFLVNKKVHLVLAAMAHLRNRDFTHVYDVKDGDEINHILARINLVTQNLQETIKHIVDNSGTINHSATNLTRISDDLNAASMDVSEKVTTVSAAVEEMSVNNQSIAKSMEQTTETINGIAGRISEMSSAISEISRNTSSSKQLTSKVVDEFDSISATVHDLGRQANDVDAITDQIRAIAEQVSMLALNAKIEAARAGEAGKGFAVVAAEITELASQTNEATVQADEKLQHIKGKSSEVANKVNGLTTIVNESDQAVTNISAAVEQADATTREISANVNDISSKISVMNANITEGAVVASEIAKEITIVENGSKQVKDSSLSLNEDAVSLSRMARDFMALVRKFKV